MIIAGVLIVLLAVSFIIYSQISAQGGLYLTQGDFAYVMVRVMGLEEQLAGALGQTLQEKSVNLLASLGYAPWGGWNSSIRLTKGDVALVLAVVLGYMDMPVNQYAALRESTIAQAFEVLAAHGIVVTSIPTGKPEDPLTESELANIINNASDVTGGKISPYPRPVSPVR